MADTDAKMLQAILDKVNSVDKKVDDVKEGVEKNGERIDKLGLHLAELEDDAPTREEHEELEGRVTTIEENLQI